MAWREPWRSPLSPLLLSLLSLRHRPRETAGTAGRRSGQLPSALALGQAQLSPGSSSGGERGVVVGGISASALAGPSLQSAVQTVHSGAGGGSPGSGRGGGGRSRRGGVRGAGGSEGSIGRKAGVWVRGRGAARWRWRWR